LEPGLPCASEGCACANGMTSATITVVIPIIRNLAFEWEEGEREPSFKAVSFLAFPGSPVRAACGIARLGVVETPKRSVRQEGGRLNRLLVAPSPVH
jgi:hypothetical protein